MTIDNSYLQKLYTCENRMRIFSIRKLLDVLDYDRSILTADSDNLSMSYTPWMFKPTEIINQLVSHNIPFYVVTSNTTVRLLYINGIFGELPDWKSAYAEFTKFMQTEYYNELLKELELYKII